MNCISITMTGWDWTISSTVTSDSVGRWRPSVAKH